MVALHRLLLTSLLLAIPACADDEVSTEDPPATLPSGGPTEPATTPSTSTAAAPAPSLASRLCAAGEPVQRGTVAEAGLAEISGLAASPSTPGVLWAAEDSGNPSSLYAIDEAGQLVGEVPLGVEQTDWEDLAPGPDGTVFVGDVGDNARIREDVAVLEVALPADPTSGGAQPLETTVWRFTYPDGPVDAEALMWDPVDGDLYVVTKALDQQNLSFDSDTVVYRLPRTDPGTPVQAEEVARLQLGLLQLATAADISSDGAAIAVRTYASVFVWDRPEGTTVGQALQAEPCRAPSPDEGQGEALAFAPDGSGYYTVAEGASPPVWFVPSAP